MKILQWVHRTFMHGAGDVKSFIPGTPSIDTLRPRLISTKQKQDGGVRKSFDLQSFLTIGTLGSEPLIRDAGGEETASKLDGGGRNSTATETETEVKHPRASLEELIKVDGVGHSKKGVTAPPPLVQHIICGLSPFNCTPSDKKLRKMMLRVFHKKVHPDGSAAVGCRGGKRVKKKKKASVREKTAAVVASSAVVNASETRRAEDSGQWIRTDDEYLVLEL